GCQFRSFLGLFVLWQLLDFVRKHIRFQKHHEPAIQADAEFEDELGIHARDTQRRAWEPENPEDVVEWQDLISFVKQYLAKLPEQYRTIADGYMHEVPLAVLAQRVGTPARTVRRRWAKIVADLRERLT